MQAHHRGPTNPIAACSKVQAGNLQRTINLTLVCVVSERLSAGLE